MATTADHIAARSDPDLLARMIATAEQQAIPSATSWVQANMGQLLSIPVEQGQTIADVHAYASNVRKQAVDALPALPGKDPAAVTDNHLETAIQALLTPPS